MSDEAAHSNHAQHNLNFLQSFYKSFQFNDWSITVAFYSSVHIIESALFKTKTINYLGKSITVEHSEELFDKIRAASLFLPKHCNESTHSARRLIIELAFPEIDSPYKALFNACHTARYIDYNWKSPHIKKYVEQQLPKIITWSNSKFSSNFSIKFS